MAEHEVATQQEVAEPADGQVSPPDAQASSPATAEQQAVADGATAHQADAAGTTAEGDREADDGHAGSLEELAWEALKEVYDPEIGLDIVSLGLVYGVQVDDQGELTIDMTLTSPYCPLGGVIETQASAVCNPLPGIDTVRVNFVWSPPWDPRTMASDEAKLELGIY